MAVILREQMPQIFGGLREYVRPPVPPPAVNRMGRIPPPDESETESDDDEPIDEAPRHG